MCHASIEVFMSPTPKQTKACTSFSIFSFNFILFLVMLSPFMWQTCQHDQLFPTSSHQLFGLMAPQPLDPSQCNPSSSSSLCDVDTLIISNFIYILCNFFCLMSLIVLNYLFLTKIRNIYSIAMLYIDK